MNLNLNIYKAKFIKNYDGDTITLEIDLGFNVFNRMDIRLADIDTKELRGSNEEDKKEALTAKKFVYDKLNNSSEINVKTFKKGKFGRYAGIIYYKDNNGETINLCEQLLENQLAVPYS